jgi:hypothetical protein
MDLSPKVADWLPCAPLVAVVAALAVNVLAQIALVRLSRGTHFLRSAAGGFAAGLLVLALFEAWLILRQPAAGETLGKALFVSAPTYVALSYCFFNFINLGQSSIRIRLYSEIAAAPGGVSVEQMTREYNEDALMHARLQRLTESGDIVERDGRYFVGRRRLVPVSAIIFGLKAFILGKTSEFEEMPNAE